MRSWAVQDAKARFSELVETCLQEGPQMVTRRGAEAVVVIPVEQWRLLNQGARPTLKELLLSDFARTDTLVPPRGPKPRRRPPAAG